MQKLIVYLRTKLHNYVIRRAKEIGNEDYDTVGVLDWDVVDPQQYGIDPLQGRGQNAISDFGYLQTHPELTSKNYPQQWTSKAAVATAWLQMYNRF
jgi:hypothetical protein